MLNQDFSKKPISRTKKDILAFVLISSITFSSVIYFYYIQSNSLGTLLNYFDLDYLYSGESTEFGIEGSEYITNEMKLKFICKVPSGTEKVWVKLDSITDWILLDNNESFSLTARTPYFVSTIFTLHLQCDENITLFSTTIYDPDLPVVKIYTTSIITNNDQDCTIFINPHNPTMALERWANRALPAEIRQRDLNDSYSLELNNNEMLLNMRDDDDWLLLPSKEFGSAFRTKLAYDVYNMLNSINPMCKISNAEPVDLFIDDCYMGLYLLTERVDRKLYNLSTEVQENSEEQDLIFKGNDWNGDNNEPWEQIFPNEKDYSNFPVELDKFLQYSNEQQFFNTNDGIFSKINRQQLIDFLLFGLLVGHDSLEGNKLYLVRNNNFGSKLFFTPWDFDISWGISRTDAFPSNYWFNKESDNVGFAKWNHIFYRLLFPDNESLNNNLIEDLEDRWLELRSNIWTTENLVLKCSQIYKKMREGMLRDDPKQPPSDLYNTIIDWINGRVQILDEPFNIPSNLPQMFMTCEEQIGYSYKNCSFRLYRSHPGYRSGLIEASIRLRGTRSHLWDKKGYRLELHKNEPLLGMRNDDDWLLFACYLDFTRMRYKLAFNLWRSILPKDATAILPETEYIMLYLNGEFQGLYLLSEKMDKKLLGFDQWQNNTNSSLMFQLKQRGSGFRYYDPDLWEQDWPNLEDINIMDTLLPEIIDFVNNTSDAVFFDPQDGIFTLFNKTNLIDFFLFNYYIYHNDFWDKNYFIVRNSYPSKYYLVPWDHDGCFGRWGWLEWNVNDTDLDPIRFPNYLYYRLLDNASFLQDCKARWFELRAEIWTDTFLSNLINEVYDEIDAHLEIEMYDPRWKPITDVDATYWYHVYGKEEFNLNEHLSDLFEFVPKRLEVIDTFFAEI